MTRDPFQNPLGYHGLWNRDFNTGLGPNPSIYNPTPAPNPPGVPNPSPTPAPSYGPGQPAPSYGPGIPGSNPIGRGTNQNPLPDLGKPGLPTGGTTPGKVPVPTGNPATRPGNQYEKSYSPYGQTKSLTTVGQRPSQLSPDGRWFTMPDGRRLDMNLYNPQGLEIEVDPTTGAPRFKPKQMTYGWEKYNTPTGHGRTGVIDGQNYIKGNLYDAEGLNQGDASNPLGTGFGNYLRAHAQQLGIDMNQVEGLNGYTPPPAAGVPPPNPGTLKGGADAAGQPLSAPSNFGPLAPGTVPTNPITRGQTQPPFNPSPQQIPGTNPLTRNSNFVPKPVTRYDDFVTSKGPEGTPNPALTAYGNSGLSALDPRFSQSRSQGYRKPLGLTDLDTKGGGVAEVGKPNPTTPPTAGDKPGQGARVYETGPDGRNPQAEEEYNRILNGRNPWGTTEQYFRRNNNQWQHDPNADLSGLPEYLRRQYRWNSRLNEDGTPAGWEGPGTVDRNGRAVVPIGDQSQAVGGENSTGAVIDWNLVWYDNDLGMVTSPENLRQHQPGTGSRIFRGVVQTFIAAGFVYALGGAMGLYGTPSGATLTPEALTGLEAAGNASIGTEAAAQAVASLPAGTVTSITSGASGALQAVINGVTHVWNGARWVVGAIGTINGVSNLLGRGNVIDTGRRGNGMPNNTRDGGFDLGQTVTDALGVYQGNRNLRDYDERVNRLMEMGDPMRADRERYLQQLRLFHLDPSSALQSPEYQGFREQRLGNVSRGMNARGLALSGNEMGELNRQGTLMDYEQIERERESLRRTAGMFDPSRMAGEAMRGLPFLFQMRANRDARAGTGVSRLLDQVFNGRTGADWLRALNNGQILVNDLPEELQRGIGMGADGEWTFDWNDAESGDEDDLSWYWDWITGGGEEIEDI